MSDVQDRLRGRKFIGGALCLDFVNMSDMLGEYGDLLVWAEMAGALDSRQARHLRRMAETDSKRAEAVFGRAVRLRNSIHRIFSSRALDRRLSERDLAYVSSLVGRSAKHLRLVSVGEAVAWGWHGAEDQLDWPAWIIARSAADLLISDQLDRVRECAGTDCGWLFVDTSRNRSRRWCDMSECGNRAKARRNYARKRNAVSGDDAERV